MIQAVMYRNKQENQKEQNKGKRKLEVLRNLKSHTFRKIKIKMQLLEFAGIVCM